MSKHNLQPDKLANFHCCAEWHLRQSGSLAVLCVYALGYRLSKKSGVYSAAHGKVGDFFGMDRKTIEDAVKWLVKYGFFKLLTSGKETWESNTYRVVSHKEWAKSHAGQCCEKIDLDWDQVELGKQLYADSGGRVKFKDFQIANYQKLSLPDEAIRQHWREFLTANQTSLDTDKRWRRSAGFLFWEHLKSLQNPEFHNSEIENENSVSSSSVDAVAT